MHKTACLLLGLALATATYSGCSDDEGGDGGGGDGGAGDTGTGTTTDTGTGTGTGTGTSSGTETETGTGTAGFDCELAPDCTDANEEACSCVGCTGECLDVNNAPASDCVCPSCAADPFCTDPNNCEDDGICDPAIEGCHCADCFEHPEC